MARFLGLAQQTAEGMRESVEGFEARKRERLWNGLMMKWFVVHRGWVSLLDREWSASPRRADGA